MLKTWFIKNFYVKVYKNQMLVRLLGDSSQEQQLNSEKAFSNTRLLIAEFSIAEKLLRDGVKTLMSKSMLATPAILIQAMEMYEGGLSEVENRVLTELASGAGAFKVVVHYGKESLSDAQVLEKLK